ncbi:MAG: DUF2325 domain-containing protein [Thermoplasmata archaeon]|nr:DUF2325 domain-containing protein [Thermoplasmata archaeon]
MSLNDQDQKNIIKASGIKIGKKTCIYAKSHGALVCACQSQNPISEHVERLLQKEFQPYEKEINGLSPAKVCGIIERGKGFRDVPLPALIWFAVRYRHKDITETEERIFSAIHVQEHKALVANDIHNILTYKNMTEAIQNAERIRKERDKALTFNKNLKRKCRKLGQKNEELLSEIEAMENKMSKLGEAFKEKSQLFEEECRLNKQLRTDVEKLGGTHSLRHVVRIEKLTVELETMKEEKSRLSEAFKEKNQLLEEEYDLNHRLRKDLEKLGGAHALHQIESMREKIEKLSEENRMLSWELDQQIQLNKRLSHPDDFQGTHTRDTMTEDSMIPTGGNGEKKVAFVGGIESLVPQYSQITKEMNCAFCYNSGACPKGKKEIQQLVNKVDVVFCPVDINSHSACLYVKQACKSLSKPCYFLHSSSLSTFKRSMVDFVEERFERSNNLWHYLGQKE